MSLGYRREAWMTRQSIGRQWTSSSQARSRGTTWTRTYKSIRKACPCDLRPFFAWQREEYSQLARLNADRLAPVDALRPCTSASLRSRPNLRTAANRRGVPNSGLGIVLATDTIWRV